MPRKLAICNKDEWFLGEAKKNDGSLGYPIFYRYVISCSIAYNIIKHQKDITWISDELETLRASLNGRIVYQQEDFLELYPLAHTTGFVLVDKTNSCYPLIIYGERFEDENKPRDVAFKLSLEDVHNNLEKIFSKLSELDNGNAWTEESEDNWLKDWNFEFQQDLRKLYSYKG